MEISNKDLVKLIKELCLIPSPSGQEKEKARFVEKWLSERSIGCTVDKENNVIVQFGDKKKPKIVFMAHTDTVFPIDTKLEFVEDGDMLKCPGVGDNIANVAGLMMVAEYLHKNKTNFNECNMVFVFNTGEEGLGNLAGCKHFMATNKNIKETISVDLTYDYIFDNAVGSHRYEIKVSTEGGHSFHAFGANNAIHIASSIITDLYRIEVPKKEGTKTTYNVGTISGGTTVNSIAQFAKMLYEYRSDNHDCLGYMKHEFDKVINKYKKLGHKIEVSLVGDRPCAKNVNDKDYKILLNRVDSIHEKVLGKKVPKLSASLDFNIPLSMGIPSLGIGIHLGKGFHTIEEFIYKSSLNDGMKILLDLIMSYKTN